MKSCYGSYGQQLNRSKHLWHLLCFMYMVCQRDPKKSRQLSMNGRLGVWAIDDHLYFGVIVSLYGIIVNN